MSSDLSQNSGDRSSNSDKISHDSDMTAHESVGSDMAGLLTNQFGSNAQNSKGKEKDGSGFLRSSPRILQKMQKLGSVKQKSDIVTISGKANNKNALTTNGSGSKNDKVMSMNESALSANASDRRNLLDNEKEIENKAGQDKKDEENTDVESSGTNTELSASKTTKKETKADSAVSKDNSTSSAGARKFSVANKAIKVIPTLIKRHSEKKELLAKKSPYSEQQTVNVKNATNLTVSGNKSAATNGKDKNGKQKDLKTRSASAKQSQGDENMSNKTDSAPRSKHSELVNEGGDKTGGMPHVGKTKWTALITPATTEGARGKSTEEGIGNPLSPKVIVSDKDEKEHNTALTVPKENHGEDEANRGSRLSVQSSHSRRESFSRMSIDSRFVDFSKTQNATVVHPPGMEEDTKKGIVANNDSYIQSAIPYLPMGVAIVCLILNVILPGTGTMVAGCAVLCSGRPRIESKDDTVMTSCCVNLMVGLCQLFTVTFMMVGWFWSLAWGIHMVILAGEYKLERRKEHELELKTLVVEAFRGNPLPNSPRLTLKSFTR